LRASADDGAFVPLFCDLQGVDSAAELELCVADAIAEASDLLTKRGLEIQRLEDERPLESLARLLQAIDERGCGVWLLCDEVDEAAECEVGLLAGLGELWRLVLSRHSGRLLIASSARFASLGHRSQALGALLAPFSAPIHLGALDDSAALDLLRQARARKAERPAVDDATARLLLDAAGGHPMLLQMLAKRWWESGDADAAIRRLDSEHTLEQLGRTAAPRARSAQLHALAVGEGGLQRARSRRSIRCCATRRPRPGAPRRESISRSLLAFGPGFAA
jgi:hypothetical protein